MTIVAAALGHLDHESETIRALLPESLSGKASRMIDLGASGFLPRADELE